MTVPTTRGKARDMALAMLGRAFDQWREGFAEKRRNGASEAEVAASVASVIATVAELRGKIDDKVLDEIILIVQEAAYVTPALRRDSNHFTAGVLPAADLADQFPTEQ